MACPPSKSKTDRNLALRKIRASLHTFARETHETNFFDWGLGPEEEPRDRSRYNQIGVLCLNASSGVSSLLAFLMDRNGWWTQCRNIHIFKSGIRQWRRPKICSWMETIVRFQGDWLSWCISAMINQLRGSEILSFRYFQLLLFPVKDSLYFSVQSEHIYHFKTTN